MVLFSQDCLGRALGVQGIIQLVASLTPPLLSLMVTEVLDQNYGKLNLVMTGMNMTGVIIAVVLVVLLVN